MRECAVILNLLIANVFWLICKDEGKRRNDRLGEGGSIFPYIKTYRAFLKTSRSFCLRIGLHIRWHKSTRIYASGHTYIRIELHVRTHEPARIYVIVSGSVISDSLSMGDKGRNNKSPSNMQFDGLLSLISSLLDYQDSNLDKQNQNLLCYHYTIVQSLCAFLGKRCKDTFFYLYSPNIFALFFATICKCLSL